MPDVRELGRRFKAKHPGAYDDLSDEEVGRKVKAKWPGAYDDFTDTPAAQPQQQPQGVAASFQTGLAGRLLNNVIETAADFYNAPGETLERAGRAGLEFISAFDPAGKAYEPTVQGQAGRVAELNRRADERLPETVQLMKLGQQVQEARPRTRAGRAAFGAGSVIGEVAFPTAPESAVANIVMAPAGGAAVRGLSRTVVAPVLRRLRGGGAATEAAEVAAVKESMVQSRFPRQRSAPEMRMPDSPNPVQRAGPLPRTFKPEPEAITEAPTTARSSSVLPGLRPQQQSLFDAAARSPWQDSVLAYYRANLLTNPVGRALDLGSTFVNQFSDAAARPIAAAADVIVSKFTGARSITGPSLGATGRAVGSIRQGMRDAGEVMSTGRQAIDSGVDDVLYGREIQSGLGQALDVPVNGVFRIMGAMDAPFRRFGFVRNLHDRARTAAINEAKRGRIPRNQIDSRAGQLLDRHDIIQAAVRDGERAVLSEPNRISSWLATQTRNNPNARLAVGIVQPFMRIPLNAILRAADFSGVGGIKALYKIARGGVRKAKGESFFRDLEDQRVFAQNVASGSFAPAAFLLGIELEEQGKLEGYYYTSKKDFPNDRVPTSIEIGGERHDINRLGGYVAAPMFMGATYNRLRRQGGDQWNAFLRSFSGLIQQAPALGYYGAPAKAGRILTADEPGGEVAKEAGQMASGFIPASGALGATAKALDPAKRREAEGFTGPIMSRIPGLRERLPEKKRAKALKK